MGFVFVNQAEIVSHDTKTSIGVSGYVAQDTNLSLGVSATVLQDTRAAIGAPGSVSFDTLVAINPKVAFIHNGGLVLMSRAPKRPTRSSEQLQAVGRSAGGVDFGFDSLGAEDRLQIDFVALSSGDYQGLSRFFFGVAKGMSESFQWVDVNGESFNVRFADPVLQSEQITGDRYNVSLTLRVLA